MLKRWMTDAIKARTSLAILLLVLLFNMINASHSVTLVSPALPVHNINTGRDYATIQEAINAPETIEGHTIIVDAGIYNENIRINKNNLTLIGETSITTIIDSQGIGEVVYIAANNIYFSGFTIQGAWVGVYLAYSNNTTLTGNIITNNWRGIYIGESSNNTFIGNAISNNIEYGTLLWYSSGNTFYHNNFIDNTIQVYGDVSTNTWDDGYPNGGNFWSDYTGTDTNGDGIGDIPYTIDADNQDRYPFINPWTPPPDIAIITVAAKTVVGQGFTLPIKAVITNEGGYTETFGVAIYANSTSIAIETITLANGSSIIVVLTWDTTSVAKGKYIISAYAEPVSGETNTEDNIYLNGAVVVSIPCDVAGSTTTPPDPPDASVNYIDVFWLLKAYGSDPTKPNWNPNLDFAGSTSNPPAPPDNRVNYVDVFWLLKNYGKTAP